MDNACFPPYHCSLTCCTKLARKTMCLHKSATFVAMLIQYLSFLQCQHIFFKTDCFAPPLFWPAGSLPGANVL